METVSKKHNFSIQLIIGKLEFDGNAIESFSLLDIMEIVPYKLLEKKLNEYHKKGIEKIKELKEIVNDY